MRDRGQDTRNGERERYREGTISPVFLFVCFFTFLLLISVSGSALLMADSEVSSSLQSIHSSHKSEQEPPSW